MMYRAILSANIQHAPSFSSTRRITISGNGYDTARVNGGKGVGSHMGLDAGSLVHLMSLYGYPVLIVILVVGSAGVPLPLSLALVLLGALSVERGGPDFLLLTLGGTAASVVGDLLDYAAGRIGGARLLRWMYRRQRRLFGPPLLHASRMLRRHGGIIIFLSRFLITTVASPVSLLVGISRLRLVRFLVWDIAGEMVFVAGNLLIGRFFGGSLEEQGDLTQLFWALGAIGIALPVAFRLGRRFWSGHPPSRPIILVRGGLPQKQPAEAAVPLVRESW